MYSDSNGGVNGMLNPFVLLYADDTVIMTEKECDMQRNLNFLNEYCNCNGPNVNISKTKQWSLPGLGQGCIIYLHLNLVIWTSIKLRIIFIWVYVLTGMAHLLKPKKLLHDKASKAMYSFMQKGR